MIVDELEPLGARVTGVALRDVGPGESERLRELLAAHGVLVLPGQDDADDDDFVAFLRAFGELAFTAGEAHAPGHPDLNVVSNVGRTTPPKSTWHVDTSYVRDPPAYTALRAVTIPRTGGETLFSDQRRALETLPEALRTRLEGREIRHVVSDVDPGEGQDGAAWHPLMRPHPRTGRAALFLTTPRRCAAITGMDDDETARTVQDLLDHSVRPDNVLAHAWRPGDVVMWDNACVLHRADHSGVVGDRVMHRGMVASHGGPDA